MPRIHKTCPECKGNHRPCHLCFGTGSVYHEEQMKIYWCQSCDKSPDNEEAVVIAEDEFSAHDLLGTGKWQFEELGTANKGQPADVISRVFVRDSQQIKGVSVLAAQAAQEKKPTPLI